MSAAIDLRLDAACLGDAGSARGEIFTAEERLAHLRAHGTHSLATSLLAPGMRYLDVDRAGFIGYMQRGASTLVLGDPVAAASDRATLIEAFLARHPRAAFVQTSASTAALLNGRFGRYTTRLGVETLLDLESWTLRGRSKQTLRTALNRASARGITVGEGSTAAEREVLSREWLATRKVADREIAFLVRPLDAPVPGSRVFCAREDGRLVGFVCFDPLFERGAIVGYVPNVSRASAAFRQGIFYAITLHAMERFRSEGARVVNLGLSPLAIGDQAEPSESLPLRRLLGALARHGNRLYSFRGIGFTKSRFRGREEPVFIAHCARLPLGDAFALMRLARVL